MKFYTDRSYQPFLDGEKQIIYVIWNDAIGTCDLKTWPILLFQIRDFIDKEMISSWVKMGELKEVSLPEEVEVI